MRISGIYCLPCNDVNLYELVTISLNTFNRTYVYLSKNQLILNIRYPNVPLLKLGSVLKFFAHRLIVMCIFRAHYNLKF